jgi:hypothetical protein
MITSTAHLEGALRQLKRMEDMLEAMRLHCAETNSPLFPIASEGYLAQIHELKSDINDYLRAHPAEIFPPNMQRQLESIAEPQSTGERAQVSSLI